MLVKTVRTSPKGQLTLPVAMLRALGVSGPAELVAVQEGRRIVLAPAAELAKPVLDDLKGWEHLAAASFGEVWDNDEDSVWDKA
ncbi:MAG: AbrB/MazE/SpoVT family DNA-binding domain-containing protein [Halobacteriales archaeon]|nr:AbrB/MazE/SpoVT family DNA-binding domain-containing protein [Halobacteriales archaeon]